MSRQADDRVEAFERTLEMGQAFVSDTKAVLLRINLTKLNIGVAPVGPMGMHFSDGDGDVEVRDAGAAAGGDDDKMQD